MSLRAITFGARASFLIPTIISIVFSSFYVKKQNMFKCT